MKTPKLNRTTHEIDRSMEFFTEKELSMQVGHGRQDWPIAILKELIDNALDACESAGIKPEVTIEIGENFFAVQDNGPGIPAATVEQSLDYTKRVSDKIFYVSPSRGQLGNALKVVYAAPFVANGSGQVEIHSRELHHTIDISMDQIAQTPIIKHETSENKFVKKGTFCKLAWPNLACSEYEDENFRYIIAPFPDRARDLLEGYAAINPGAAFYLNDKKDMRVIAVHTPTDPDFKKWKPNDPTAPAWYTTKTLTDLIAAYLTMEKNNGTPRTIRDFVSEFRGFSGTAKQKQATADFKGAYLHSMVTNGEIDKTKVETLLKVMQRLSAAPKPAVLGIIGEDHFTKFMTGHGVFPDSIRYTRRVGDDGLPYVIEVAFGVVQKEERHVITGLNFSPTLTIPTFTITDALAHSRIDPYDPVILIAHITRPRFDFTDRGKTQVHLTDELSGHLKRTVATVAKIWKQAKKQADRKNRLSREAIDRMRYKPQNVTIKEAAFQVMEEAYMKASAGGKYPANARQIYYAARPYILRETGERQLNSLYFTQTLLKDYLETYETDWDVVFDARGHFVEPHTNASIDLGGIDVRKYIAEFMNGDFKEAPCQKVTISIPTRGAHYRYGGVLFIEKEGFDPLLKAARIAERYDLAIASTKGMPVSAACDLMHSLKDYGCKVYVVRDFDKAGFSIVETLRKGARGSQGSGEIIDLGLRLEDIEGLEREAVSYGNSDPSYNLWDNGATEEEIAVLLKERVELNAMTAGRFIEWIEKKLNEHGVEKVIPDEDTLASAYRRAIFLQCLDAEVSKIRTAIINQSITVPEELMERVKRELFDRSDIPWDVAIWCIAENSRKKS